MANVEGEKKREHMLMFCVWRIDWNTIPECIHKKKETKEESLE